MASSSEERRRFRETIASQVDAPVGVDDLSRLSLQAFKAQQQLGRVDASEGSLRLFGAGVEQNTAPIREVGELLAVFQRFVSAVGAALRDVRSNRGPIPADLLDLTRLRLTPQLQAGSLVMQVIPESSVTEELFPTGDVPMVSAESPLVDQALDQCIVILSAPHDARLTEQALGADLKQLGPRTASAIRALANHLVRSQVGLGVSWRVPGEATKAGALSADDARSLGEFVGAERLDEEVVSFTAVARTVSDMVQWTVETDEYGRIRMDVSDVPAAVIRSVNVGDAIDVRVLIETEVLPGGDERSRFIALAVTLRAG